MRTSTELNVHFQNSRNSLHRTPTKLNPLQISIYQDWGTKSTTDQSHSKVTSASSSSEDHKNNELINLLQ